MNAIMILDDRTAQLHNDFCNAQCDNEKMLILEAREAIAKLKLSEINLATFRLKRDCSGKKN